MSADIPDRFVALASGRTARDRRIRALVFVLVVAFSGLMALAELRMLT